MDSNYVIDYDLFTTLEIIKIIEFFKLIEQTRTKVIKSLNKAPQMPTKIAKDIGIRPNHISMTLNQLKNKQLIKCINEEARKGRIYKLTEKGEEIHKII